MDTENVRKNVTWIPALLLSASRIPAPRFDIPPSYFQLTKWRNVDATDPGTPATVSRKTMRVNAFFSVSLPNE